MKKICPAFLIIWVFSPFALASFALLPIEDRVKENKLILIGELQDVSETETDRLKISEGTLVIERVIFGKFRNSNGQSIKVGEKIKVQWTNSKLFACQFSFPKNEEVIWFLNVDEEGNIEPLYPGATTSLDDLAEVKKLLKKLKPQNQSVKTLKTNDDSNQNHTAELLADNDPKISFCPIEQKTNNHLILTFLVILGSISLYYLLYRGKLKIR